MAMKTLVLCLPRCLSVSLGFARYISFFLYRTTLNKISTKKQPNIFHAHTHIHTHRNPDIDCEHDRMPAEQR